MSVHTKSRLVESVAGQVEAPRLLKISHDGVALLFNSDAESMECFVKTYCL